jgi:hypothetical protein
MSEETQPTAEVKPAELTQVASLKSFIPSDGSQIGGISLRGLLAMFVIATVCYMSIMKTPVVEPLYTLGTVVVSFYFGHQVGQSAKKVGS